VPAARPRGRCKKTRLRATAGPIAATLALRVAEAGAGEALGLGVLTGRRCLEEGWAAGGILFWVGGGGGGRSGEGAQISEFEAVAMGLIIVLN
jgi:hypothetical protein